MTYTTAETAQSRPTRARRSGLSPSGRGSTTTTKNAIITTNRTAAATPVATVDGPTTDSARYNV